MSLEPSLKINSLHVADARSILKKSNGRNLFCKEERLLSAHSAHFSLQKERGNVFFPVLSLSLSVPMYIMNTSRVGLCYKRAPNIESLFLSLSLIHSFLPSFLSCENGPTSLNKGKEGKRERGSVFTAAAAFVRLGQASQCISESCWVDKLTQKASHLSLSLLSNVARTPNREDVRVRKFAFDIRHSHASNTTQHSPSPTK